MVKGNPLANIPRIPLAVVLLYLVLVIWTSIQVPPFEGPDAYYHFATIDHLAETGRLPFDEDADQQPWRWTAFHAPLYYIVSATMIAPLERPDFPEAYVTNPHAEIGNPDADTNENFVAHVTGDNPAVWIVRGLSMALGLLTVVGVMVLARLIAPSMPGLAPLSALLIVLNPQFLFMHGIVSNDTLVITLSTWTLVVLAWTMQSGITTWRVLLLGVLAALASLSKASGLALYPTIIVAMMWTAWRSRLSPGRFILYGVLGLLTWMLLAGWWYLDNLMRYGDPTASSQIVAIVARGDQPYNQLASELRGVFYSFWGLFGWFNVSPPSIVYLVPIAIIGLGVVGLAIAMRKVRYLSRDQRVMIGIGALFVVVLCASWWRFNLQVNVAQGRLLFPTLPVLAPAIAFGLLQIPRMIRASALIPLLIAAVVLPVAVIRPAYAPQTAQPVADWRPPSDAIAFHFREPWQDDACLTVWTRPAAVSADGTEASMTVWWQPTCDVSGYWSVFVHRINLAQESCQPGDTSHILAQHDTMPSNGDRPFPAMQPGFVYPDRFSVTLSEETTPSETNHVHLGLYDAGGTFIRAFVDQADDVASELVRIGQCAPETLLYTLEPK